MTKSYDKLSTVFIRGQNYDRINSKVREMRCILCREHLRNERWDIRTKLIKQTKCEALTAKLLVTYMKLNILLIQRTQQKLKTNKQTKNATSQQDIKKNY